MTRIYWTLGGLLAAFAVGVILLTISSSIYHKLFKIPLNESVLVVPAAEVKREATMAIQVAEPIQVYKPEVKKKLKLPAAVIADSNTHVVAASKIPASNRPYTVSTVLNSDTGHFSTYERIDPIPWLAQSKAGTVRLTQWIDGETQLEVSRDLIQVKSLYAGVTGRIDTGGDKRVGAYVEYRF